MYAQLSAIVETELPAFLLENLAAFVVAAVLMLLLIPVLTKIAGPLRLLDLPDNNRKLHKTPIPMVGGIGVFLAVALTSVALAFFLVQNETFQFKPGDGKQFVGLLLGSGFLLVVGMIDDAIGLRGRQKLFGQVIAISILIAFGFSFDSIEILDTEIKFGTFSILVIYAWVLAVVNSINLLDGADGFASTIGVIMSIAMGVMALLHPAGRQMDAVVVFAMAGSLLGFLRFNFPPAKVFLGDAGSMLIGFVLAAIAIRCNFKHATTAAFFAPIAVLAIPFIDTAAAIIRRKLTGRSIYAVDRGHIHHAMMKRGFSPTVSLLWVAALCTMTAIGATISFVYRQFEYALVSIVLVVIVMIIGRIFGSAEFELLSAKAKNLGRSMVGRKQKSLPYYQTTVQLQGNRDWQAVWDQLSDFADLHDLNQITFDLNLPWIHESFHATRRKTDVTKGENNEWYAQLPLLANGKIFGRVELLAEKDCRFTHQDIIGNFMKLASELESMLMSTENAPSGVYQVRKVKTFEPVQPIETEPADVAEQASADVN
jgi:UDP-GlcNAc:undecaprenyl-phosphate GlcNAc-1-phosphate transferase